MLKVKCKVCGEELEWVRKENGELHVMGCWNDCEEDDLHYFMLDHYPKTTANLKIK